MVPRGTMSAAVVVCLFASSAVATDRPPPPDPADQVVEVSQNVDFVNKNGQSVHVRDDSVHELNSSVHIPVDIVIETPAQLGTNQAPIRVEGDTIDARTDVELGGFDAGDTSVVIGGNSQTYKESARTAVAGYGNTTASCFRTFGLGGSTRSNSWSFGLPLKDGDCELGEDAALAFMMGNELAAWRMYCNQSNVRRVYGAERFNRKSAREATDACLTEAGVWQSVKDTNDALVAFHEAYGAKMAELDMFRAVLEDQAATLEQLKRQSHAPAPRLPPVVVERVVYESVDYEVAAGVSGDDVQRVKSEKCPPDDPDIAAAICDGVPVLNPNRRPLPPE